MLEEESRAGALGHVGLLQPSRQPELQALAGRREKEGREGQSFHSGRGLCSLASSDRQRMDTLLLLLTSGKQVTTQLPQLCPQSWSQLSAPTPPLAFTQSQVCTLKRKTQVSVCSHDCARVKAWGTRESTSGLQKQLLMPTQPHRGTCCLPGRVQRWDGAGNEDVDPHGTQLCVRVPVPAREGQPQATEGSLHGLQVLR